MQWIKNLTAVAWVAAEAQAPSPPSSMQWVKGSSFAAAAAAGWDSIPGPELPYAPGGSIKKKKN